MARRCTAWVLIGLLGCAGAQAARVPDPNASAQRFALALRDDQPDVAYALLDAAQRNNLDRARFMRLWRENRTELQGWARASRRARHAPWRAQSSKIEDGERVALVLEDGTWRIDGGVIDAQALSTPLDAVLELRRALQRQSLPSLLRLLSQERRAAWMAAFDKSVEQTRDPLDLRVEVHGDDATVHLTGGGEIQLKREAGQWRVWDVR